MASLDFDKIKRAICGLVWQMSEVCSGDTSPRPVKCSASSSRESK